MDFRLSISVSPPPALLSPSPVESLSLHQLPPPSMCMPPPPQAIYNSKAELYASIQAWAAHYHYAFSIGRSTKINKTSRTSITYCCDRNGPPPPENHPHNRPHARIQRTASRKTGCKFSVTAVEHADGQWDLRHRPNAEYNVHNHPPSQAVSSHPSHRKLAQDAINQARSLYNAGKYNT